MLEYFVHTSIVKLATPTTKQVWLNIFCFNPEEYILNRNYFSASIRFTPEEWNNWLRPLTKQELIKLSPPISNYIKYRSSALKKQTK